MSGPADFSSCSDGILHFGHVFRLRNVEADAFLALCPSLYGSTDQIQVTVSPKPEETARFAFRFVSYKNPLSTDPIRFGDKFYIQTSSIPGGDLFLYTERLSLFGGATKKSGHQAVQFNTTNQGDGSYGTVWEAAHSDPRQRIEMDEEFIPADASVLLKSCSTNVCLAALKGQIVRSEYGVEFEVVCHTFITAHKAEAPTNFWTFDFIGKN